jgi:hypothetical protein
METNRFLAKLPYFLDYLHLAEKLFVNWQFRFTALIKLEEEAGLSGLFLLLQKLLTRIG